MLKKTLAALHIYHVLESTWSLLVSRTHIELVCTRMSMYSRFSGTPHSRLSWVNVPHLCQRTWLSTIFDLWRKKKCIQLNRVSLDLLYELLFLSLPKLCNVFTVKCGARCFRTLVQDEAIPSPTINGKQSFHICKHDIGEPPIRRTFRTSITGCSFLDCGDSNLFSLFSRLIFE